MSALRNGADIVHVFCTPDAGIPIKSYSPDLIVHPILGSIPRNDDIMRWIPTLSSLVVGCGLGRDELVIECVCDLLLRLKGMEIPIVFDGDALFILAYRPHLLDGLVFPILTPNVNELSRFCGAHSQPPSIDAMGVFSSLAQLSPQLVMLQKGATDTLFYMALSQPTSIPIVTTRSCPRRCGGQGDILAGAIGTWAGWARDDYTKKITAAIHGASAVTRCAASRAFEANLRSMTTPDIIGYIGESFEALFPRNSQG